MISFSAATPKKGKTHAVALRFPQGTPREEIIKEVKEEWEKELAQVQSKEKGTWFLSCFVFGALNECLTISQESKYPNVSKFLYALFTINNLILYPVPKNIFRPKSFFEINSNKDGLVM